MSYKDYQYEYEPVVEEDFDDYWMDENKFTQLPWEDLRYTWPQSGSLDTCNLRLYGCG